jgi:CRISPR-associated protein Cas1
MAYRHIYVTSAASLSISNNQLLIKQTEAYTIPLEDISSIVIENRSVKMTAAALSKIAEYKIALFVCDQKHIPNGLLLPFNSHSRQLKTVQLQFSMSKPFQKRIWQKIIKQKVMNQACCLELCEKVEAHELKKLFSKVESGDKSYIESKAAQIYFKALFGESFRRRKDDIVNIALNYGYSIIRGCIARTLTAHGFLPCIGIFHHSELNNFNLADDFIEPFRAFVDHWVYCNISEDESMFESGHKQKLYNLLNKPVLIEEGSVSVTSAIEMMISSFTTAVEIKNSERLKLPSFLPDVT